ncbi:MULTISPECIES: hypothetical protein [unclassified Myroides]|uniref:hypothetical protein n=1 Tax=unclassified Myroides TaxID=2642485 RepID=UPI003D2F87ED
MILDYLQFWFAANNEHGTHSPFVFNLLTRGLYPVDVRWKGQSRKEQFFNRLLVYFESQQLATLDGRIPKEVKTAISAVSYQGNTGKSYDAILFQGRDTKDWPKIEIVAQSMHNDSLWIIDRRSKEASVEKYWQEVIASEEMIVTLDFYYFGVAFKRKEQLKQHFNLRLQPDRVFRLLRV